MTLDYRDRDNDGKPTEFTGASSLPPFKFIYTKWFAYIGVATLVLSLVFSWSIMQPATGISDPALGVAVDLERERVNSDSEGDPEQWAVDVLAETLIAEDMDPDLQPVNDVGSEYISLIAER